MMPEREGKDLDGRVAVVTGAASGIGRAIALTLAKHGAQVFVGDFALLPETSAEYRRLGIAESHCDVRVDADVRSLIDAAVATAGGLDILVNNAGIGLVKQITDVTEDEWDRCLDTNLKGVFLGCKYAIPHLRQRGGGAIVNTSSNAGLLPRAHDPVYSISKAAVLALTKSLALSHAPDRIRVNAICPGPVRNTRMMNADLEKSTNPAATAEQFIAASPLARAFGRMMDPEEIASAVLYLVSDAAEMVTGTALAIDGGKSLGVPPR